MTMNIDLLRLIRSQPSAQLAKKLMQRRSHEARAFADMLNRKRKESWPFKDKLQERFNEKADYP